MRPAKDRVNILTILWGLLFVKCCLLEFLVRRYEVPINSVTYVWLLSIVMATAATWVYLSLHSSERAALLERANHRIFVLPLIGVAGCVSSALASEGRVSGFCLALAALLLAVRSAWLWSHKRKLSMRMPLYSWFFVALFLTTQNGATAFAVFGLAVALLGVGPALARFLDARKRNFEPERDNF